MKRYSKKREAVLRCLKSTDTHPSARWVYEQVKKEFPEISLATVYRNLKQLVENKDAVMVGKVKDEERFDGDTAPHSHAICIKCGKIIDISGVPAKINSVITPPLGFKTESVSYSLFGLCADCSEDGKNDRQ